jgi:hypothetical protein
VAAQHYKMVLLLLMLLLLLLLLLLRRASRLRCVAGALRGVAGVLARHHLLL